MFENPNENMQNFYPFLKFHGFIPEKNTPFSWFREFAPPFEKYSFFG